MKLVLFTLLTFASVGFVSAQAPAIEVGGSPQRPSDEAVIDTKIPPYREASDKLDELQKLATPRVTFSFDGSKELLTNLSPEAKQILDDHWRAALSYFYSDAYLPPATSAQYTERNMDWMRYCTATQQKLVKTKIKAPSGERFISQSEAFATYGFINRVASYVVGKSKSRPVSGS